MVAFGLPIALGALTGAIAGCIVGLVVVLARKLFASKTGQRPSQAVLLAFLLLACSTTAHAQLPQARLDRIYPLGGQTGITFDLEIAGKDLDEVKTLYFDHPGIKAEPADKPNHFRVTIAADALIGTHDVRAVGKFGISGARLLMVQQGLTEILEKEPNDTIAQANAVPMNCAINGFADNNGEDYFRFPAKKGERVTIDCWALRLDSQMDACLALFTADGKEVASNRDYYDRDPFLEFTAPAEGDYVVQVRDLAYAGGQPYRLIISNRPHLENVFPPVVMAGQETSLTLFGRNLPGGQGAQPSPWTIHDRPLDQLTLPFPAASDKAAATRLEFVAHLRSPSLEIHGTQWQPASIPGILNPVTLGFVTAPITLEKEPNNDRDHAQEITLPATVCGRFDQRGDADWYAFTAKANETLAINVLCERIGSQGDPFIVIIDDKGNELTGLDDHGINFNALAQNNRDPQGTWTAPRDGRYRLLIQDRYQRGGARFVYALQISKPEPDFAPVVIHETNPDPTCPVVRQGGSAMLEFCANRRDGMNAPITIEAAGLPPGLTCQPITVSPQTQTATVVFTAAPDAPEWAGAIRLIARAKVGDKEIVRDVRSCQRLWPIANLNHCRAAREICLAIRSTAPYGLKTVTSQPEVKAGGTAEFKVIAERHWPNFKGKIQLTGANLPPGFNLATAEIADGQTSATLKVTVAGNVPPGVYSLVLRGDAQVPYARDPKVNPANLRVADPAMPQSLRVVAK